LGNTVFPKKGTILESACLAVFILLTFYRSSKINFHEDHSYSRKLRDHAQSII